MKGYRAQRERGFAAVVQPLHSTASDRQIPSGPTATLICFGIEMRKSA